MLGRLKMKNKLITGSAKEREEKISNGTWMPRGHAIPTGKQIHNQRSNLKRELQFLCREDWR